MPRASHTDRYRGRSETEGRRTHDPLGVLVAELDPDDVAAAEAGIADEIDRAVATAQAAPYEPVADLTRHELAER